MTTTTDHAAQLQRAIAEVRSLFRPSHNAKCVLDTLENTLRSQGVLAASAPVPAQTGITAEEPLRDRMLRLAGEVADARAQADRHKGDMQAMLGQREKLRDQLAEADARNAELERQVLTLFGPTAAGSANASIAEETHTGAGAAPVVGPGSSWTIDGQASSTHFDEAAAAMAAESAQLLAEAERSAAKKAVAAGVDPLAVLSREVHGLSNKLQQPVGLIVQLLVLAELRDQARRLAVISSAVQSSADLARFTVASGG